EVGPRAVTGWAPGAWFLCAEPEVGVGAEPDSLLERDRQRRVAPAGLLEGEAERGEVGRRPAVLLGERQPEQAEVAHRQNGAHGERVVAVPLLGMGRDLALGEVADDLAERLLFRGQLDRHRPIVGSPLVGTVWV